MKNIAAAGKSTIAARTQRIPARRNTCGIGSRRSSASHRVDARIAPLTRIDSRTRPTNAGHPDANAIACLRSKYRSKGNAAAAAAPPPPSGIRPARKNSATTTPSIVRGRRAAGLRLRESRPAPRVRTTGRLTMLHGVSTTEPAIDTRSGRLGRVDYLIASLITLSGGVLRFITLGLPNSFVFDEVYYAKDACYYIKGAVEACALSGDGEQTLVHPPLGKWFLSIGVKLFGFDSFGWRVAAAVAGTATVFLLYVLAKRLLHSTLGASIASGLLAIDLLHLVQSRISMLDIFLPMFAIATLIFLVIDRDQRNAGTSTVLPRVGAGLMLAGGLATKWSGGFFIPFAIALVIAWEAGRRRAAGPGGTERNLTAALRAEAMPCFLFLVVLPVAAYVVTYVGRLDGALVALPWSEGSFLREVWDTQFYMLDYHANLTTLHGYQS
ncbi:MAG: phospholipid carrier-dependent glycosyltransferase, partial [Actinobacteria bacterium]|nr:phospholipid carrier-dependent glycosyltransferase [Actinomycetota bacterium]